MADVVVRATCDEFFARLQQRAPGELELPKHCLFAAALGLICLLFDPVHSTPWGLDVLDKISPYDQTLDGAWQSSTPPDPGTLSQLSTSKGWFAKGMVRGKRSK
jgi:hypothetical protein